MRTLHQLTKGRTAEQNRQAIAECGDALGALDERHPVWQALRNRFELAIAEANDLATLPANAEREFYVGGERLMRDLWQELEDLRNGEWKNWPEFAELKRKKDDEEEDDER